MGFVLMAHDMLLARGRQRALSPLAWGFAAGLTGAVVDAEPLGWWIAPTGALLVGLVLVALYDLRYFIIPDQLTIGIAAVGASSVAALEPASLESHCLLAAAAYLAVRAVDASYRAVRGRAGIGEGDARLLAASALWLDTDGLVTAVLIGVVSALICVALMLRDQKK